MMFVNAVTAANIVNGFHDRYILIKTNLLHFSVNCARPVFFQTLELAIPQE